MLALPVQTCLLTAIITRYNFVDPDGYAPFKVIVNGPFVIIEYNFTFNDLNRTLHLVPGSSQSSSGATEDVLNFASSFAPDIVDVLSIGLLEANSDVLKNIGQSLSNISEGLSSTSAIVGTALTFYETSMNIEENYNAGASEGKMRWDSVVDMSWGFGGSAATMAIAGCFAFNPFLGLVACLAVTVIINGLENFRREKSN